MADANVTKSIDNSEQTYINICYMISGLCTVVGNLIVLLTILFNKKLRAKKEMVILGGMAFGDLLYGLGFLFGGARRLFLVLTGQLKTLVSRWYCMKEIATFFYIMGPQMGSLMNLFLSVDRLIAIAFVKTYMSLTVTFGQTLVGIAFSYAMLSYSTAFIISYGLPRTETVFRQCLSTWASNNTYAVFYTTQIVVCATMSVVIYLAVMIILKWRTDHASTHVHEYYHERQIQVTKTLSIVSLLTLVFYVTPWLTHMTLNALKVKLGSAAFISPLMWVFIQSNNALNVIIYMWKFKNMRSAFLKMIGCKSKVNPWVALGAQTHSAVPPHIQTTTLF